MADITGVTVSECETYHVKKNKPLYDLKFDKVLKFHQPGLAPVADSSGAYHIGLDGMPTYRHRYAETFGYYEDLASVRCNKGEWFHIDLSGDPVYQERYEWCGNYQDGCCVVKAAHGYTHIDHFGNFLYETRFAYAGDFRDDIAVVQDFRGRYTHITKKGKEIHGKYFSDLDVYHKSFARAKDEKGYCHIDFQGNPIYLQRYAMVEPFYNGIARVESFYGAVLRINTQGEVVETLVEAQSTSFQELSADIVAFWRSQTIKAAVSLDLFEYLPATCEALSHKTKVPMDGMKRLLRALGELDLICEHEGVVSLTEKSVYLTASHDLSLKMAASYWIDKNSQSWRELDKVLLSGREVYSEKFGSPFFESLAKNPEELKTYQLAMRSYARHDYSQLAKQLDLSNYRTVIDAAGGSGALLFSILEAFPHLVGQLLDMDKVIKDIELPQALKSRVEATGFDLFSPWPAKADVIFLARVLHDWSDDSALMILQQAVSSMNTGGELCIIEFNFSNNGYSGGLLDLNMSVETGGKERTLTEYTALAEKVGLQFFEKIAFNHYHLLRFKEVTNG